MLKIVSKFIANINGHIDGRLLLQQNQHFDTCSHKFTNIQMVVQLLVQQGRHEIVRLLLDCMRSHLLLLVVMPRQVLSIGVE